MNEIDDQRNYGRACKFVKRFSGWGGNPVTFTIRINTLPVLQHTARGRISRRDRYNCTYAITTNGRFLSYVKLSRFTVSILF